jgi:hypothetical protein
LGREYEDTNFTGRNEGASMQIETVFNSREHSFSSSSLRQRVVAAESQKLLSGKK